MSRDEAVLGKKLILVGTADARIREAIQEALGDRFQLKFSDNGAELLEMARSIQPAAIILDLFMRKLDGLQLCQILKSDQETSSIPIVAVSSMLAKNHALQAGANAYIAYPFQKEELYEILGKATGLEYNS